MHSIKNFLKYIYFTTFSTLVFPAFMHPINNFLTLPTQKPKAENIEFRIIC